MRRAYLTTGQEVEIKGQDGDVVFYAPLYEDGWDNGLIEGPIQSIGAEYIHDKPPTAHLHKELVQLRADCEEARTTLRSVRQQVREQQREVEEMQKRREAHEELHFLDQYLQGQITHLLVQQKYSNKIAVWGVDKQLRQSQRYDEGLKVICLFGNKPDIYNRRKPNRDMVWRVNTYSDGSGSWSWSVLSFHSSEEEAHQAGRDYLTACIMEEDHEKLASDKFIEQLEDFGLPIPHPVQTILSKKKRQSLESEVEKARLQLQMAEDALRELEQDT